MSRSSPLRGVAVGAGYFSGFHYEAWRRLGVEMTVVVDRDLARAGEAATRHGIPRTAAWSDLNQVLGQEKPDFIDIITPPETHLEAVRLAAAHGIAIVCQKPLAPTWA